MAKREDLQDWVIAALKHYGGSANIVQVAQHIWSLHKGELENSRDLFFTWQYDMRWACTRLRKRQIIQAAEISKRGEWCLTGLTI